MTLVYLELYGNPSLVTLPTPTPNGEHKILVPHGECVLVNGVWLVYPGIMTTFVVIEEYSPLDQKIYCLWSRFIEKIEGFV